jgi:lipopolysaccharide/colanic/teichoic acid biosynthesis glycosyltransferase
MNWGHPEQGKVLLLAGDSALAAAAVLLARLVRPGFPVGLPRQLGLVVMFVLVYTSCFYVFDLYDVRALNGARTITRFLVSGISGTCILSFFLYLFQWPGTGRGTMAIAVPSLLAGCIAWRDFYKNHARVILKSRKVLLLGNLVDAVALQSIMESAQSRYVLSGYLKVRTEAGAGVVLRNQVSMAAAAGGWSSESRGIASVGELPRLQSPLTFTGGIASDWGIRDFGNVSRASLEITTLQLGIDTIVLRENSAGPELAESLTRLRFQGVRILTMPDLCSQLMEELPLDTLSDTWFSFAAGFNLLHERIFRKIKRLSDIVMACAGLLITLPLSVLTAIAIKLESRGPVLFQQGRIGWKEMPFTLLKFRSMREDAESDGIPQWTRAEDPRVTRVGRILRTLHIDEIPQMINVLVGEMSFVGPRPERPAFVEQLKERIPFYSLRHHLPPGITGWAQVNYPYGASVEDAKRKLQFDLYYVRHASPTLDLRILLRTARVVLFRRGSR